VFCTLVLRQVAFTHELTLYPACLFATLTYPDSWSHRGSAESSLTLPGVTVVVDSGLRRISCYEPATGMSGLKTVPISAASAAQRAGRAGRVAPGICVRLWPQRELLTPHTAPQIELDDLAGTALTLASWGAPCAATVARLPWLTAPPTHSLADAHDLLRGLGAIRSGADVDASGQGSQGGSGEHAPHEHRHGGGGGGSTGEGDGRAAAAVITVHGRALARMPLHPRLGHMVVTASGRSGRAVDVGEARQA